MGGVCYNGGMVTFADCFDRADVTERMERPVGDLTGTALLHWFSFPPRARKAIVRVCRGRALDPLRVKLAELAEFHEEEFLELRNCGVTTIEGINRILK